MAVYGRLQVPYSPLGVAMSLVDRPPELHVRFRFAGGAVSPPYRYIPATGPDGLFLSSYATDVAGYAEILRGTPAQIELQEGRRGQKKGGGILADERTDGPGVEWVRIKDNAEAKHGRRAERPPQRFTVPAELVRAEVHGAPDLLGP